MKMRHAFCHILKPFNAMRPGNLLYFFLLAVEQLEECAALAELCKNEKFLFVLRYAN